MGSYLIRSSFKQAQFLVTPMRRLGPGLALVLILVACRSHPAPFESPISPLESETIFLPLVKENTPRQTTPTTAKATLNRPPVTSTAVPPPSPTPLPPVVDKAGWGVQVHLFGVDVDETLLWAQGTGVDWIKQQVEWNNIEQSPDTYDWRELDQIVEKAHGYGFQLMLSLNHAPSWLRTDPLEYGPPHDPAEFGRFMGILASRYNGRVAAYELWNEPNLRREWRGEPLDPKLFVALIREGSLAIRAADPTAQIISGAPAVTGINDGVGAVDDRVYLRGMIAAGVSEWVDGIGVHPYGFANPPEERWDDSSHFAPSHNNHPSFFFRDTLEDYRAILAEGGAASRPLWVTEFGWPSIDGFGAVDTTDWEYARHVSKRQQADYIVKGFQMARTMEGIGPVILWNLNIATIWGEKRPESAYSLLRPDGSYRPAYIAVRIAEP
jgi:hypothetical protein